MAPIGGTWALDDQPDLSLIVAAKTAQQTPAFAQAVNVLPAIITDADLATPWWIRFQMAVGPPPTLEIDMGVWFGQEDGNFIGLLFTYTNGQMPLGTANVIGGNLNVGEIDYQQPMDPTGAYHEFLLQYDGAGGLSVSYDGAEVSRVTGWSPITPTDGSLELLINVPVSQNSPKYRLIEAGLGIF